MSQQKVKDMFLYTKIVAILMKAADTEDTETVLCVMAALEEEYAGKKGYEKTRELREQLFKTASGKIKIERKRMDHIEHHYQKLSSIYYPDQPTLNDVIKKYNK